MIEKVILKKVDCASILNMHLLHLNTSMKLKSISIKLQHSDKWFSPTVFFNKNWLTNFCFYKQQTLYNKRKWKSTKNGFLDDSSISKNEKILSVVVYSFKWQTNIWFEFNGIYGKLCIFILILFSDKI